MTYADIEFELHTIRPDVSGIGAAAEPSTDVMPLLHHIGMPLLGQLLQGKIAEHPAV